MLAQSLKSLEEVCTGRGDIVRRLVADAFLDFKSFSEEKNVLDSFFLVEKVLTVNTFLVQMMSTKRQENVRQPLRGIIYALLPDMKFKEQFAVTMLHHYPHLVAADLEEG